MKTRIKTTADISFLSAGITEIIESAAPPISAAIDVDENETRYKPPSKAIKIKDKAIRAIEKKKIRIKNFAEIIKVLPAPGERLFIIGGGNIDAIHSIHVVFDFVPVIEEMYIATWSMTRDNIQDLFTLFDNGKIKSLNILISIFFRGKYRADYPVLIDGMKQRYQKIVVCENHAKIILMKAPGYHLVASGSANFTCNPRIEQVDFTNSKQLYDFNREWMESVLQKVYPEIRKKNMGK